MEQISIFGSVSAFPHTYEDLQLLYQTYIARPNDDPDAFTSSDVKGGGRSFSFYGQKALEFYPGDGVDAKLKLPGRILSQLLPGDRQANSLYTVTENTLPAGQVEALFLLLKEEKRKIFRNTITEKFACCHAFKECSNKGECLFPNDRFFNGCEYRKNLEAGRNFYRDK